MKAVDHLDLQTLSYDAKRFDFTSVVASLLGRELTTLHEGTDFPLFTYETDQDTPFHRCFYDGWPRIEPLYREFVLDVIVPTIGWPDVLYQRVPTFRVHLPGNLSVGELHRDSKYNHQPGELNFWVPLTHGDDTSTVWIERDVGAENLEPFVRAPGEVLMFDGVSRLHGCVVNTSDRTRVSFDFRVVSASAFEDRGLSAITSGIRFREGDYFVRA